MIDIIASARLFAAASKIMDAGQLASDGLLLEDTFKQYISGKKQPDYQGLSGADLKSIIAAISRLSLAGAQLADNADDLALLRSVIASLGS